MPTIHPSFLPPWQDPQILPQILQLAFVSVAPIGMILGFVADVRGAPEWLVGIVEMASVPLLPMGFMAGAAV